MQLQVSQPFDQQLVLKPCDMSLCLLRVKSASIQPGATRPSKWSPELRFDRDGWTGSGGIPYDIGIDNPQPSAA